MTDEQQMKNEIIKSLLSSEQVSTIDKFIIIANLSIVSSLIIQTLDFVDFLFNHIKKDQK